MAAIRSATDARGGEPSEHRFSLTEMGDWATREIGLVAELEARIHLHLGTLAQLIDSYRARAVAFNNLDQNVSYHAFWQGEVRK